MVASLARARQFFNRHTIPRRCRSYSEEERRETSGLSPKIIYREALPIDENSEPYPAFDLRTADLAPFGVGIALYFKQLQWLCVAFLLYGVISLNNMIYFGSGDYDSTAVITGDYYTLLPGTAYCNDYETVTATSGCPDGSATCDSSYSPNCQLKFSLGVVNLVGILFLLLYIIVIAVIQEKEQHMLDESIQTCSDYSVTVMDPGPEDDDPVEWKEFFSQFGEVAYITIGRGNSELLAALGTRRNIKANIKLVSQMKLDTDSNSDSSEQEEATEKVRPTETTVLLNSGSDDEESDVRGMYWRVLYKLGLVKDVKDWTKELEEVNKTIKLLSKKKYPVTRVYCVFTTERAKINCLKCLATGALAALFDWKSSKRSKFMFKGTNVLHVTAAIEPSDVIWENLELGFKFMAFQRIVSLSLALLVVYFAYLAISAMKDSSSSSVLSIGVSVINSMLPYICYYITMYERHRNQSNVQVSLMVKLLIARFMNTTLISYLTTDAVETLTYDSMATIQALMVSDAFVTPFIASLDIYNTFCKYCISPLSLSQKQMNTYFLGSAWDLAERYTSMLKTVFVAVFYAAVYPPGLFFASFCFAITYVVDRYMLMRLWKRAPQYDAELARKAVKTIFITLLAHLVVSFVWYAEWPFDTTYFDGTSYAYVDRSGLYNNVIDLFSTTTTFWMSDAQTRLVQLYQICALVLLSVLVLYLLYLLATFVIGLFHAVPTEEDDDQHINFNKVDHIPVFVPMCQSPSALVGDLVAACPINLRQRHYPHFTAGGIFVDVTRAFMNNNLAAEFSKRKRQSLFGIVQGFHNEAD